MLQEKCCKSVNKIYELLRTESIIIYGVGFVADFFYRLVNQKGLAANVIGFMVSEGSIESFKGLPVFKVKDQCIDKAITICIAVHESSLDDIKSNLEKNEFRKYVCIYPYLINMWLGEPKKQNESILVKDIWNRKDDQYAVAARYLVIGQYFSKNTLGYEIYKKMSVLPQDEKTKEKRLKTFLDLIQNCESNGFDFRRTIKIFDDYKVIDGNHRLAVAIYFGVEHINCDVYSSQNRWDLEFLPKEKKLNRETVEKIGFTEYERDLLEQTIIAITEKML